MDTVYNIWLQQTPLVARQKQELLTYFGEAKKVYEASYEAYFEAHLEKRCIEKLLLAKKRLNEAEKIKNYCEKEGIYILDKTHPEYPFYLKQIVDSPIVLFIKGQLASLQKPLFAIVGSRKCSEYGYEMAYQLASNLAQTGITIVSGMALGIDEAAHKGALRNGDSIAVLGTGVDCCYPKKNYGIYKEMCQKGCLVTEYEPGIEPLPFHFPLRNRIISGMTMGVLVVEADIRSGSLITANLALEYNREVFAVPGNITSSLSSGTNELIKHGAKCVTCIEDILEELPIDFLNTFEENKKNSSVNPYYKLAQHETIVYAYVSWNPICLEELLLNTRLPYMNLLECLVGLETRELIKRLPGERYVRIK
ncbi:DNA-protecting protein DprA [Sporanaerobium hydrogeniformans]|uniref:DNA-protecting protein DprA n=1 Tax=Sporanaerobium hydrogeniformans TaxID=3072179 RepID=A0AC61DD11_9FIRM|nr:DNA-processing protein DprA [Sporanaerobium hydrogeniformans]PHV71101.1 DNA-protecting protein DprA [Sporanaerobium hydrogeniformans]